MASSTVAVKGIRELRRDLNKMDKSLAKEVRLELKSAGEIVRVEAASRFSSVDRKSAAGYRTRVRARGVAVEQSLGRTTGKHPQFGRMQLVGALIPALEDKQDQVVERLGDMLDRLENSNGF